MPRMLNGVISAIPFPVKRLAARFLERRGYVRFPEQGDVHVMMARRQDVSVQTVIDVGASDGRWSAGMMWHYPEANYLLIEAQEAAHGKELQQFKAAHPNVEYLLAAAGDRDGEINFDATLPLGGVASHTPLLANNIVVPMVAIDTVVRERKLRPPFLVKLDTHGFEGPILEGAAETLKQSSMLIIEAYPFTLCPGAMRFYELCQFLEPRGFRCVDIFEMMHRPLDRALWAMDMVFLPSSHPVLQSNGYGSEASDS